MRATATPYLVDESNPTYSLIVATRNRPAQLRELLTSIERQGLDVEIILVDQSDSSYRLSVSKVVSDFLRLSNVHYILSQGRGLSIARNEGLRVAKGRFLGFPDDDCTYPDEFLATVQVLFDEPRKPNFVLGSYRAPGADIRSGAHVTRTINSWNAFRLANSITLFIDRRKVDERCLVFNENLGAGTALPLGEETDIVLRLIRSGAHGIWSSRLVAFHPPTIMNARTSNLMPIESAYGVLLGLNCRNPLVAARAFLGLPKLLINELLAVRPAGSLRARVSGLVKGLLGKVPS